MPSPPSTRQSESGGRRSSAFVREDSRRPGQSRKCDTNFQLAAPVTVCVLGCIVNLCAKSRCVLSSAPLDISGLLVKVVDLNAGYVMASTGNHQDQQSSTHLRPRQILATC